jgi:hypothetical protein
MKHARVPKEPREEVPDEEAVAVEAAAPEDEVDGAAAGVAVADHKAGVDVEAEEARDSDIVLLLLLCLAFYGKLFVNCRKAQSHGFPKIPFYKTEGRRSDVFTSPTSNNFSVPKDFKLPENISKLVFSKITQKTTFPPIQASCSHLF